MTIKARGGGNWDSGVFGGSAEKWLDSEFMLKVELTGFAVGFHVGCEKRGVQDDFNVFGLKNWKDEVVIYWMGKKQLEKLVWRRTSGTQFWLY